MTKNDDGGTTFLYDRPQRCEDMSADKAYARLVAAAHEWATEHMDQWEKFKFDTPNGPIYVTISMNADYPHSFDQVAVTTVCKKPEAWLPTEIAACEAAAAEAERARLIGECRAHMCRVRSMDHGSTDALARAIQAAVAAEREACALVAAATIEPSDDMMMHVAANAIAAAIRASPRRRGSQARRCYP